MVAEDLNRESQLANGSKQQYCPVFHFPQQWCWRIFWYSIHSKPQQASISLFLYIKNLSVSVYSMFKARFQS